MVYHFSEKGYDIVDTYHVPATPPVVHTVPRTKPDTPATVRYSE